MTSLFQEEHHNRLRARAAMTVEGEGWKKNARLARTSREPVQKARRTTVGEPPANSEYSGAISEVTHWTWRWGMACTWKGKLNCLRNFNFVVDTIKKQMSKIDALDRFENSVFGHFLKFDLDSHQSINMLLWLFGHEVNVSGATELERWYRIGEKNHRFGKVEYCQITGLRFGSSDFNPESTNHFPPENGIYRCFFDGTAVQGRDLLKKFEEGFFNDPDEALKVALVLFVHFSFLAQDGRNLVALWLWTLVEDRERFEDFPWGSYNFQRLSHYLNTISPPKSDQAVYKPSIKAYLMPLQLWAYETFPIFVQKSNMKSGLSGIPRGIRWKCTKNRNCIPCLYRDDMVCTPMCLTEEEKVAPFMRDIEMNISEGFQYVHLEHWVSSCASLKSCCMKGPQMHQPTKKASKAIVCPDNPTLDEDSSQGVGNRAKDDPSQSVSELMHQAVSSAGVVRQALDLELPGAVERATELSYTRRTDIASRDALQSLRPGYRRKLRSHTTIGSTCSDGIAKDSEAVSRISRPHRRPRRLRKEAPLSPVSTTAPLLRGNLFGDLFNHCCQNIWSETPKEKTNVCANLYCLWFYMYTEERWRDSVVSWIKNVNIFSKRYVFIPIVLWKHWSLLIFCHLGESFKSKTRTPCMLLLDSALGYNSSRLKPLIKRLIADIYRMEGRPESDAHDIPLLVPNVPQQRNDHECGVFVLLYMNLFLKRAPENFSISRGYPYFMNKDWFTEDELERFYKRLESFGPVPIDSEPSDSEPEIERMIF